MPGYLLGLLCLAGAVLMETTGQIALKVGTRDLEPDARKILERIAHSRWVQAGILAFIAEAVFWTWTLHFVPLIIAFPMGAIVFATVAIAAALVLKERITPGRRVGIALIVLGVVLLGIR